MRKIFLLTITLSFYIVCNAQNDDGAIDYGLYIRHQQLGEYDATYQFFYNSNMFTYCTDMYNSLTGYVCIGGKFNIEGDTITFYDIELELPEFTELVRIPQEELGKERVTIDSTVIMRQRPTSSNFWSITGNVGNRSRKTIKLDPSKRYSASFFRQENDEYIEIDGERFYEDPGPSD